MKNTQFPFSLGAAQPRNVFLWALGIVLVWFTVKINTEAWNVLVRTVTSETGGGLAKRVAIVPMFLGALLICILVINHFSKKSINAHWIVWGLIFSLALVFRLAWIFLVPTNPESDFKIYHEMALQLSSNQPVILLKPLGYPFLLSIAYRFFPDAAAGRVLNVGFGMATVVLVYWAAKTVSDSNGGLFAMLWMALSPSEIFMSSVLGSEVAILPFVFGAIAVTLYLVAKGNRKTNNLYFIPGILLGFSVTIRPTSALVMGALLAYMLLIKSSHKDRLLNSGRLMVGLLIIPATMVLWTSYASQQLSLRALFYDSYPLLSGTNIAYKGVFNLDDAELYVSVPEEMRSEMVFETAWERMTAVEFPVLLTFFSDKLLFFLSDNLYGSVWPFYTVKMGLSFNEQFTLQRWIDVIAQSWYFLSLIGTSVLIIVLLFERNPLWVLLTGIILFSALPHTVFEVQNRYHHLLLPVFSLACGVLCWRLCTRRKVALEAV